MFMKKSCHPVSPTFHYKFSVSLSRSVLGQYEVLWKVKVLKTQLEKTSEKILKVTCSTDPLHVTSQLFLQLLLFL